MKELSNSKNALLEHDNLSGLKVLLVGNNPLEMSKVYEQLQSLKERITSIYISFNDKEVLQFIKKNKPNCVLIDDNYGKSSMKRLLVRLKKMKGHAYSLTLLKTTNTSGSVFGFQDYLMKESLNPERLYISFKNALKFREKTSIMQ